MSASPSRKKKLTLASIFFTFFVDNLCWSIVFPIFAPFFLDPENKVFSPEISAASRTTILGIFLAAFPLAQFFGSPMIGEYADHKGRKKALVYTIFFSFLALALSAYSFHAQILSLLFVSRLISGVFSGNLSICLAAIADLSKDEQAKTKNFGYLAAIAGFSFIIGVFLGGEFSDVQLNEHFSPAFPLWIATGLTFLNFLFVLFGFKETKTIDENMQFKFLEGINNIQMALKTEKIKVIYVIYFLFLFSWNILLQFTPVHVIEVFDFSNHQIGIVAAFMGVCWAVGAGLFNKFLLHRFSPLKVLEFSLLTFTILCALIIVPKNLSSLVALLGVCVVLAGIAWPICTSIISSRAGKNIQGKILGMSQSVQSLAMALSPLVAVFSHIHTGLPFIVAALASFLAGLVYFKVKL